MRLKDKSYNLQIVYRAIALSEHKSAWYDDAILKIFGYLIGGFSRICITLVTSVMLCCKSIDTNGTQTARTFIPLCVSRSCRCCLRYTPSLCCRRSNSLRRRRIPLPLSLSTASDERENASGGVLKTPLKL